METAAIQLRSQVRCMTLSLLRRLALATFHQRLFVVGQLGFLLGIGLDSEGSFARELDAVAEVRDYDRRGLARLRNRGLRLVFRLDDAKGGFTVNPLLAVRVGIAVFER